MPHSAHLRYAFIADIHANLPALEAVIKDARAHNVHHFVCLGDVVGYGPQPVETLELLRAIKPSLCLGNHDAAACGLLDTAPFNAFAKETAERAQEALSDVDKHFLHELPYILEGDGFVCTHGTFFNAESFYYLDTKEDVERCFALYPEVPLFFVAHTHIPCVYERDAEGVIHKLPPQDFTLKPQTQTLVNLGTVGFPRSANLGAAYCIYDAATKRLLFRSVPYNLNRYSQAVVNGSYDLRNYWFLSKRAENFRQELAFRCLQTSPLPDAPPPTISEGFQPHTTKERSTFLPILLGLTIVALVCALFFLFELPKPAEAKAFAPLHALVEDNANILPPLSQWSKSSENVAVLHLQGPTRSIYSAAGNENRLKLVSPLTPCVPGTFRFSVRARSSADFSYTTRVVFTRHTGRVLQDRLHMYKTDAKQSYSVKIPEDAVSLRVEIDVRFVKTFQLFEPRLFPD